RGSRRRRRRTRSVVPAERSGRGDSAPGAGRARGRRGCRDRAQAPGERTRAPAPWAAAAGRADGRRGGRTPRCNAMTPGNGSPAGMDRFALDAGTAEGLVSGAVDVGDAPPEYRAVATALQALREPPESWELVGGPAVAERIATTVVAARRARAAPRPRRSASRARVAVASFVALVLALSGGLASAGALPEPAQGVA